MLTTRTGWEDRATCYNSSGGRLKTLARPLCLTSHISMLMFAVCTADGMDSFALVFDFDDVAS